MKFRQNVRTFLETSRWTGRLAWDVARHLTIGVIVATIFVSVLPALQIWIGRGLINAIFDVIAGNTASTTTILWWLGVNLIVILLQSSVSTLKSFFTDRLNEQLQLELNLRILSHATKLDLAYFEDVNSQDTVARTQENASLQVSGFIVSSLNLIAQALQTLSVIAVLVLIDWVGIIIMLPLIAVYIFLQWRYIQKQYHINYKRTTQRRWARYFVGRLTSSDTLPEVKLLGIAPLFIDRYSKLQTDFINVDRHIRERYSWLNFALETIFTVVYIVVWGLQIPRVLAGNLQPGDWVVYGRALVQLQQTAKNLGDTSGGLLSQMLYVTSLNEFLSAQPSTDLGSKQPPDVKGAAIEFQHVSFMYPGSPRAILKDITFKINSGEFVAVVGENGAGKSTLVKLLIRLYAVSEGQITLNGVDIQQIDLSAYHKLVAYMPQQINRYEATAAENIAYGNWEQLHDQPDLVQAVARKAGIHDTIAAMPQAYETLLGRRFGTYDLSGGQWQRLAIARVLARDARILIWDEPTSSLDVKAESSLLAYLREVGEGHTTFFISHRFTNIHLADRVIVLDSGRIVEMGTHDQLLAQNGHYAHLYELHNKKLDRISQTEG